MNWIDIINIKITMQNSILPLLPLGEKSLIKFNDKFPEQTEIIKYGVNENIFYILNHGLTHCI